MVEKKDFILTGKAREDFYKYYYDNYLFNEGLCKYTPMNRIDIVVQNALIIEFFDNSGKMNGYNSFENIFYRQYRNTGFKNRKEATAKAIERANEIFNNR